MSLNNPWVMAGVAAAVYGAWYFGQKNGYRWGYSAAQQDALRAGAPGPSAKFPLAYDPTALTATVSNAGSSGMTIASNPAISSVNTNGAAYNV